MHHITIAGQEKSDPDQTSFCLKEMTFIAGLSVIIMLLSFSRFIVRILKQDSADPIALVLRVTIMIIIDELLTLLHGCL